ncbi:MAG: Protein kinase [Myxococcaceae bacterium]|nr:Protein kinase [Myxococcaceae bacterium]
MSLKLLTTGVPGLDAVLGGGLPEYSFNLLAGAPGCGKTTLVHQLTFANATAERPAIYFTVVGEPPLKMLRYQQQMAFFDPEKAGTVIRFVDLSQHVLTGDLNMVLDKIVQHVEEMNPAIVVVDSFRTVLRSQRPQAPGELELQGFLQRLALLLTSWQVTSFLVGEYVEDEIKDNPVFTVADGIIWLSQHRERSSAVRKLDIVKMRGMATMPGLHTFRISDQGVQIFPRTTAPTVEDPSVGPEFASRARAGFGVPGLDEMLGGGLPVGDATLIGGPSGTGKTVLSTHFIAEGVARGERGVLAVFEEQPKDYLVRAQQMGLDLLEMSRSGAIKVIYLRPLDLSAEEILHQIQQAVTELGARRLVIDSLNGVELALATTFREDFRDSLYRLVNRLTGGGVSVLMTVEVTESFNEIKFSPHAISFLAQNIVFLRYVEIESQLRKMMAVVKMRRSHHSHELREYELTDRGMNMLGPFREHEGMLTGVAKPRLRRDPARRVGLSESEQQTLDVILASDRVTALELSRKTGLSAQSVEVALGRLHALNYILETKESGQTHYSALERPLGGSGGQS